MLLVLPMIADTSMALFGDTSMSRTIHQALLIGKVRFLPSTRNKLEVILISLPGSDQEGIV